MTITKLDDLHVVTQSLRGHHLGSAFDLLSEARAATDIKPQNRANVLATRLSASCIIHSYCALESHVNLIGHDMFSDESSRTYIAVKKRSFLVQKLVQTWNNASVLEKLFFLACDDGVVSYSEHLQQRLRELNNLRNWLVHGFTYTTTLLLRPKVDETYEVLDTEDSVNWGKKFPQCKFNSIHELGPRDAFTALQVVLDALEPIAFKYHRPIEVFTAVPSLNYQIIEPGCYTVEAVLGRLPSEAV